MAIGGTIGLEALVLGPITGASMNPARSLAPALGRKGLHEPWIYIVGPWSGALVGVAIYEALRGPAGRDVGPADAQLPVVVEQVRMQAIAPPWPITHGRFARVHGPAPRVPPFRLGLRGHDDERRVIRRFALTTEQKLQIKQAAERLRQKLDGVVNAETIERYMNDSLDQLIERARMTKWVPLLAERYAGERLRALVRLQAGLTLTTPAVLFLCVHNAGRSQMAAGWMRMPGW